MTTPLLYRPEDAAEALSISRTRVYELMAGGQLDSVKVGRLRRIPAESLTAYIDALKSEPAGAA